MRMFLSSFLRPLAFAALFAVTLTASARCGEVNYSWGHDALAEAATYVLVIMEYVVGILYAIASLLALYSATSIYVKLNAGEEGFTKSVMVLVGSILFLISATLVMPALFGVNYGTSGSPSFWDLF